MNFSITLRKGKAVYLNVKDSCDGSGLNTSESSKVKVMSGSNIVPLSWVHLHLTSGKNDHSLTIGKKWFFQKIRSVDYFNDISATATTTTTTTTSLNLLKAEKSKRIHNLWFFSGRREPTTVITLIYIYFLYHIHAWWTYLTQNDNDGKLYSQIFEQFSVLHQSKVRERWEGGEEGWGGEGSQKKRERAEALQTAFFFQKQRH